MAGPTLMVADDLADRSSKGLIRSRIVQENAIHLAQALHLNLDLTGSQNRRADPEK